MSEFPDFYNYGYQVKKRLGQNYHSGRVTYQAIHLQTKQKVVIKLFQFAQSNSSWHGYQSIESEIKVLKQLHHPRIPRYLDSFAPEGGVCLVQEYKNAQPLSAYPSFTPEQIQQIAVQILEILDYIQHFYNPIIHRDIKPENVLLDYKMRVYLIDFGLAKIAYGSIYGSTTMAGTAGFMPPEKLYNQPLNKASDIYSLGVTLICLVTGIKTAEISNLIDLSNHRLKFRHLASGYSKEFLDYLDKMVEPDPKKRLANLERIFKSVPSPQPIQRKVLAEFSNNLKVNNLNKRLSYAIVTVITLGLGLTYGLNQIEQLVVSKIQQHLINGDYEKCINLAQDVPEFLSINEKSICLLNDCSVAQLNKATKLVDNSRLIYKAITEAKKIPAESNSYEEAQTLITQWKEWQSDQNLIKKAQQDLKKRKWQQAKAMAAQVKAERFQHQAIQIIKTAETKLKYAELERLAAELEIQGEKLIIKANHYANQRQYSQAISIAKRIHNATPSYQEAQRLIAEWQNEIPQVFINYWSSPKVNGARFVVEKLEKWKNGQLKIYFKAYNYTNKDSRFSDFIAVDNLGNTYRGYSGSSWDGTVMPSRIPTKGSITLKQPLDPNASVITLSFRRVYTYNPLIRLITLKTKGIRVK
ncbi:MAG: protein kinase [Moorea sp. SIO3I7]|nr:protein kinase [Moorena sp. SIO3I7]